MSTPKKVFFSFIFFLILCFLLEIAYQIRHQLKDKTLLPYNLSSPEMLHQMETWPDWESSYNIYDENLGWKLRPSVEKEKETYSYRTNKQGYRSEQDYQLALKPGILRLGIFGDSFIHGDEVGVNETIGAYLTQNFEGKAEQLNFGVSGYGSDQALLTYEKVGLPYKPQVVVLGYLTQHIARNVNRFRRFYIPELDNPFLSKPRFILKNGQIELVSPVTYNPNEAAKLIKAKDFQTLSEHEFFYFPQFYEYYWYYQSAFLREFFTRKYRSQIKQKNQSPMLYQNEECTEISFQILKRFCETARKNGATPVVFTLHFLQDFRKWDENSHYWKKFIERCKKEGIPILDCGKKLSEDSDFMQTPEKHFMPQGHYSPELNKKIGRWVFEFLLQQESFKKQYEQITKK